MGRGGLHISICIVLPKKKSLTVIIPIDTTLGKLKKIVLKKRKQTSQMLWKICINGSSYNSDSDNKKLSDLGVISGECIFFIEKIDKDQAILWKFTERCNGKNWNPPFNEWSMKHEISKWRDVDVDQSNNVIGIRLPDANISGILPIEFSFLSKLVKINLAHNELSYIPDSFKNLECLSNLRLDSNYLTTIPDGILLLPKLRVLNLKNNQITEIPMGISLLSKSLASLNLSDNCLRTVPPDMGYLENLTKLWLASNSDDANNGNQLMNLPPEFGNLKNLRFLSLLGNNFEELPGAISELEDLRSLDISCNCIHSLPRNIGNLKKLEVLRANDNFLQILNDSFFELISLNNLYLNDNVIKSLDKRLEKLLNLTSLSVENNELSNLSVDFSEFELLKYIRLKGNFHLDRRYSAYQIKKPHCIKILELGVNDTFEMY